MGCRGSEVQILSPRSCSTRINLYHSYSQSHPLALSYSAKHIVGRTNRCIFLSLRAERSNLIVWPCYLPRLLRRSTPRNDMLWQLMRDTIMLLRQFTHYVILTLNKVKGKNLFSRLKNSNLKARFFVALLLRMTTYRSRVKSCAKWKT